MCLDRHPGAGYPRRPLDVLARVRRPDVAAAADRVADRNDEPTPVPEPELADDEPGRCPDSSRRTLSTCPISALFTSVARQPTQPSSSSKVSGRRAMNSALPTFLRSIGQPRYWLQRRQIRGAGTPHPPSPDADHGRHPAPPLPFCLAGRTKMATREASERRRGPGAHQAVSRRGSRHGACQAASVRGGRLRPLCLAPPSSRRRRPSRSCRGRRGRCRYRRSPGSGSA